MLIGRKPSALTVLMGIAAIMLLSTGAHAGWFPETRLTIAPDASYLSGNNARCFVTDPEGDLHLVWYDYRDGEAEIYHSRFDGTVWSPEAVLTSSEYSSESPSLAADATGGLHLVWSRYGASGGRIHYRHFNGTTWEPSEAITDPASASEHPSVAVDDTGRVHVVWRDYSYGSWHIYYKVHDGAIWSGAELLSDPAGYPRYPSITAGEDGQVHVTWDDYRHGNWEIYYRVFDGAVWGAEERLTVNAGASESPVLLIDTYGEVHVFWDDDRGGSATIYHKVNDGMGWSADEPVVEPVEFAVEPYVAAGDSGHMHVAWYDEAGYAQEVYYQEFDGSSWSPKERISVNNDMSRNPAVAVGGDGVVHVVWHDDRKGNFEIYWRANRDIPEPEILSIDPSSEYAYQEVHITDLAGTGFFSGAQVRLEKAGEDDIVATNVAVESDTRITCDFTLRVEGYWDVVVENLDAQADTLIEGFYAVPLPKPEILSIDPDSEYAYQEVHIADLAGTGFFPGAEVRLEKAGEDDILATNVAVESDTRISCDFSLTVRGYWDVLVRNVDGKSDTLIAGFYVIPLPDPELVSIMPSAGRAYESIYVSDLAGINLFSGADVWLGKAGESDIHAARVVNVSTERITCSLALTGAAPGYWDVVILNQDGGADTLVSAFEVIESLWGADVRLTNDGGYSSTSRPNARCIDLDSMGEPHVVWYDDRNGHYQIFYKCRTGGTWGPDVMIASSSGEAEYPSIALDSNDHIHVVWADDRNGNWDIYYRLHDGAGWQPDTRLTDGTGQSRHPSIGVDGNDNLHLVWQNDRSGTPKIFYGSYDGAVWSPGECIEPAISGSGTPAVAVDGFGHVHVVWYQDSGSSDHLYYKSYDGTVWGESVDLAARKSVYGPTITVDSRNMVHVAWHDARYGVLDYEVFHRRFNGLVWEPEVQITDADNNSHNATLAADSAGNVYLMWADRRSGDNKTYYARNDGAGWGGNVLLAAASQDARLPSVASTPEGVLHLIWRDSRDGNTEIYYKSREADPFAGSDCDVVRSEAPRSLRIMPNPVRNGTEIRFHLGAEARSDLAIFDITGRLVSKMPLGELPPGTHHVTWDMTDRAGRPVAPGVYFVSITTESHMRSAKIVVLH